MSVECGLTYIPV